MRRSHRDPVTHGMKGHLNTLLPPSFSCTKQQRPQVFEVKSSSQTTTRHCGYSRILCSKRCRKRQCDHVSIARAAFPLILRVLCLVPSSATCASCVFWHMLCVSNFGRRTTSKLVTSHFTSLQCTSFTKLRIRSWILRPAQQVLAAPCSVFGASPWTIDFGGCHMHNRHENAASGLQHRTPSLPPIAGEKPVMKDRTPGSRAIIRPEDSGAGATSIGEAMQR